MSWIGRFLAQPSRPYRNFQIAFTILTLNFTLPAASYSIAPEIAFAQFMDINRLLGGAPYDVPELDSFLWRYLAAANVMTLGFMCALLQWNLRRWRPVVVPLAFMKGYATLHWAVGFLLHPQWRFFAGAAVLDAVSTAAFLYFTNRAARDIEGRPDEDLVPRPRGGRG